MKNGAVHAKAIRQMFNQLKRGGTKPSWPESDDVLEQLMLTILSEGNSPARAKAALNRMIAQTIDLNDLRVSTPNELAQIAGKDLTNALQRTTALVRVLNAIYEKENRVALEHTKSKSKRDVKAYLESLDGMTPYAIAGTLLWGFGEHTVPVDEPMLAMFKKDGLIDEGADVAETQVFLKRHIKATEAKAFTMLSKRQAAMRAPRGKRS